MAQAMMEAVLMQEQQAQYTIEQAQKQARRIRKKAEEQAAQRNREEQEMLRES